MRGGGSSFKLIGRFAPQLERVPEDPCWRVALIRCIRSTSRVDVATRVDLGGASLTAGDGVLVRGKTLYLVRNQLEQVAVFRLNAAGTAGQLVDTLTSDDFDIPTTVAAFGNSLYLPNARFSTPPTPDTPYWITRIDRRS
jgi:hypothetical protein